MSFILNQAGRSFFRSIIGPPRFLMFDAFYCCLMVGLNSRKIGTSEDLDTEPFLNNFPEEAKAQADLIAGLLIDAELDRKGVGVDDRERIEHEVTKLVDPTSGTRLNGDGDRLLNLYAAAGLDLLKDAMMPPGSVEEFLIAYGGLWLEQGGASPGSLAT